MWRKGTQNIKWLWLPLLGMVMACAAVGTSQAQSEVRTIWGPYVPHGDGEEVLHFFGPDSAYFFVMTSEGRRGKRLFLYQISYDSLQVIKRSLLSLPDIDQMRPFFYAPLVFGGRTYILTTAEDPLGSDLYIHAFALDEEMNFTTPPQPLGRVPKRLVARNQFLQVTPSTDGKHLVVAIPTEEDPARNEKLDISLFDENLSVIHEKKLEVPHASIDVEYGDMLVDSDQAVYVLMSKPSPGLRELDKVRNPGREHFLLRYSWVDHTLSEKLLSIGLKWIYELMLAQNSDRHIQVFGYYSNMIDLIMAGTFSVSFDRISGTPLESGLSPFDRAFKTQFRMQGNITERSELSLFRPRYAYPKAGNHMLMISEKQDVQTSTVFNPASGTYFMVENYLYDEILFTKIGPDGEAKLNFKIPKFQSTSRGASSFTSFISWEGDGRTFLVFNDHERNSSLDLHTNSRYSVLTGPAYAQAVMYEVSDRGEISKHTLYRNSPERCILIPQFSHPVVRGMVLFNQGSNGWQLSRIEVQ